MSDAFHEARVAATAIRREYTSVVSLNTASAFTALLACERAVTTLYRRATDEDFPYQGYPRHKPGQWVTSLGLRGRYSQDTQRFLDELDGYALDKARYEGSLAFRQYTSKKASDLSRILVDGVDRFLSETASLAKVPDVAMQIRCASKSDT
jgi:hypothetical protein